jgi:phospholipase/carboxylesterase
VKVQIVETAGLTTRVVGPDDASATAILLHGFGAPGDDLVALAPYLRASSAPGPASLATMRFVFPAAPTELGGLYGDSRAWWPLDMAKLEASMRSGKRDTTDVPPELAGVRAQLATLVGHYAKQSRVVLGGFSQGAMLSLDVALHGDGNLAGVVLLSGTLIAETEWTPLMRKLASTPIFMSHGRRDPLLPFAIAETLRDKLVAAGASVDWHPFDGAHEIPPSVLDGLARFLAQR